MTGIGLSMSRNGGLKCFESARLDREWRTVSAMLRIYCHGNHKPEGLFCPECEVLSTYARARLQRCVFQGDKPTCAKCPVHCYQASRREEMKRVMRYAGPRMLWKHPVLTVRHWLDALDPAPELEKK